MPHANSIQPKPADLIEQVVSQIISLPQVLELVGDPRVKRALLLIHTEPQRDWRYQNFADRSHRSVDRFSRVFMGCVGIGLPCYLRKMRVLLALPLIDARELTLQEIALQVGFSNEVTMRRAFKEELGICPSKYHHDMTEIVASNGNCL
ncbi:MAG: helix-turn-helix transcriptional regulator [Acidobacteria bacterium]|nr:helix-turn-helix transcriptional regulator [Acidobacteriota bacterium]